MQEAESADTFGRRGKVQNSHDVLGEGLKVGMAWPCNSGSAEPQHPQGARAGKAWSFSALWSPCGLEDYAAFLPVDVSL